MKLVISACMVLMAILSPFYSYSQNNLDSISDYELGFINHCISIGEFEDAIYLVNKFDLLSDSSPLTDTLNYLKGWSFYQLNQMDSSINYLSKVSPYSSVHQKSQFYSAINQANSGEIDAAVAQLYNSIVQPAYKGLRNFELAGIYLLQRNFDSFAVFSSQFDGTNVQIAREEEKLMNYRQQLSDHKNRSAFLAGALSAVIPGTGKLYAGRFGDGISAFLMTTSIGFVAFENIKKDGIIDPKSIFFTGVFSIFYIGDIWGSVFSVQMQNEEFNNEINHNILFDLHIPLRRIFK